MVHRLLKLIAGMLCVVCWPDCGVSNACRECMYVCMRVYVWGKWVGM